MIKNWTGAVAVLNFFLLFTTLIHVGLQCTFPYTHPGQIGVSTLDSSLGKINALTRSLRLCKLRCPNCSWIVDSISCLRITVTTSRSSRFSLYNCMFTSGGIGLVFTGSKSSSWNDIECNPLGLSCNNFSFSRDWQGWSEGGSLLFYSGILWHVPEKLPH